MPEDLILREEIHPGIVGLTFNRSAKLNALSTPMLHLFEKHLDQIETDPNARVLILQGAGDKAFIAGADIREYQGSKHREFNAYQRESRRIFDKLEALSKPTIAAIKGYALGGGFEIALCCDLLICGDSAQLGLPEGRLGLSPGGGGTQRLTHAIGKYEASNIMLAGWRINAERAYQLGLTAMVCADADLSERVLARAKAMLKIAPLAQAQMKYLMREGLDAPQSTAKSLEQQVLFELYMTDDGQEGINAFLEKRDPKFIGK